MKLNDVVDDLFLDIGWVESFTVDAEGRAVVSWSTAQGPRLHRVLETGEPAAANELPTIDQAEPVAHGTRYAFWARMANEDNTMAVFVADRHSENATRLPFSGALHPHGLCWQDRDHVITTERTANGGRLVRLAADGTTPPEELYRLPDGARWLDPQPQAAPDGTIAMIVRTDVSQDLVTLDPATGATTTLVAGNRSAAPVGVRWSPDGKKLVLLVRRRRTTEVRLIDLTAGTLETLVVPPPCEVPSFDADGRRIAFSSSAWPWNHVHVFDLTGRVLSTAPLPADTSAERHQWHGADLYFRVFRPDLPPALFRWRPGAAESEPVTRPLDLAYTTRMTVRRLPTPEGFDLPAMVHEPRGPARGTVVMLHGGPAASWRVAWNPVLLTLTATGYRVALIETRGTTFNAWPVPPIPVTEHGVQESLDVGYCVAELVRQGLAEPGKVVLAGHSHGAYVAYRASLTCPGVAGVIMTSGYLHPAALAGSADSEVHRFVASAYTGSDAGGAAPDTLPAACPVLGVHGEFDRQAPAPAATRLFDRLAGSGHEWLLLPGEEHAFRRRASAARYTERAVAFLGDVLDGV
ncbi:S9 family peptidase [Nonomuraea sp. NPDC004297]